MKKKHEAEKENSERWLLTYADMITLLMLFFIVMYAMSTADKAKFEILAESLSAVFSSNADENHGIGTGQGKVITEKVAKLPVSPLQSKKPRSAVYDNAYDVLKSAIQSKRLNLQQAERGLVIQLGAQLYFKSGSAELPEDIMDTFLPIVEMLKYLPNNIQIEGYAEDLPPEGNSEFRNNWELSSQRALNVLETLQTYGAAPNRLSAVAYGDTRPEVSNETAEGRAYNNQVSIVVLYSPE